MTMAHLDERDPIMRLTRETRQLRSGLHKHICHSRPSFPAYTDAESNLIDFGPFEYWISLDDNELYFIDPAGNKRRLNSTIV